MGKKFNFQMKIRIAIFSQIRYSNKFISCFSLFLFIFRRDEGCTVYNRSIKHFPDSGKAYWILKRKVTKMLCGKSEFDIYEAKNASLIQKRLVYWSEKSQKCDFECYFSTFRFNTQEFPESGKCFFASEMSNSDFPHVFTPRGVISRKNF